MLVDQYGNSLKFAHAATQSPRRGPVLRTPNIDVNKLIPMHDRNTLAALSRRLFTNMGVPRAAILQKADFSVGEAFLPSYVGKVDKADGEAAADFFRNVWFPNCDVRGGLRDWQSILNNASVGMDRDGDSFLLLTTDESGEFPLIQQIPGYAVNNKGMPDNQPLDSGSYAGSIIRDGVIYDGRQRAIAYRISTGDDVDQYNDVPAYSVIHLMDEVYQEQGRGFPAFTHALEDLRHCLQSTEYERVRQMIISSIGLIENNEIGGADLDDPANDDVCCNNQSGVLTETYEQGQIRYFKANSGSGLTQLKHENPGEVWESFHDRMIRSALVGIKWSYSMVWKAAGQGTAERADVLRARRAIVSRQKTLKYAARRMLTYAYSVFRKTNRINQVDAPFSWIFSTPPILTVDDGREQQAMREGYKLGTINMTEIQASNGKPIDEFYRERAEEVSLRKRIAQEIADRDNVIIDDREMVMLTPNETATPINQPNEPAQ
jgi:capsid protein